MSKSIYSSISFPIIRSFNGCLGSTSKITILPFGIDTIEEIEGLAVKNGIGLIEEMPIGVLTKSKIETFPKNGATLGRVHTDVSIIDEKAYEDKIGILTRIVTNVDDAIVIKAKELIGIDEEKIVEQTIVLIEHGDEIEWVELVAEDVTVNLIDEVVDTSIVISWS